MATGSVCRRSSTRPPTSIYIYVYTFPQQCNYAKHFCSWKLLEEKIAIQPKGGKKNHWKMPRLFNTSQSHHKKERVKKITYTGGSDATQCCVQSQFAHRNSHTLPINRWQPIHCELLWLQHMVTSSSTYIAENLEKSTTFKLLWNKQVCICCTNKREEEIGGKGKKNPNLEAKITKSEDSFSISNNNNFYILLGPVLQDVQNLTPGKGLSQKHTQHTTHELSLGVRNRVVKITQSLKSLRTTTTTTVLLPQKKKF
jgi:hypothetical protein